MKLNFSSGWKNASVGRFLVQLFVFHFMFSWFIVIGFFMFAMLGLFLYRFGGTDILNEGAGMFNLAQIPVFFGCALIVLLIWGRDIQSLRRYIFRVFLLCILMILALAIKIPHLFNGMYFVFVSMLIPAAIYLCVRPVNRSVSCGRIIDKGNYIKYPVVVYDVAKFIFVPSLCAGIIYARMAFRMSDSYDSDLMYETLVNRWMLALGIVIVWVLFWRRVFLCSFKRILMLLLALVLSGVLACVAFVFNEGDIFQSVMVMPDVFEGVFLMISILIFKRNASIAKKYSSETVIATDFDFTVYCPACHYDMSGSTKLRCPECGTEYAAGRLIEENVYIRNPDLWLN